jgi:predicted GTPase
MMDINNINILVLGHTGSGKSTMINYLYGSEVLQKGTGRPVTKKGDFTPIQIPSPLKAGLTLTILDSWGLESNKADEWKDHIKEKLKETWSYTEMIYCVIYCLAYSNDRIQDFEIEILKELLQKGYKIVIALTMADDGK